MDRIRNGTQNAVNAGKEFGSRHPYIGQVLLAIAFIFAFIIVAHLLLTAYKTYSKWASGSPWVLHGTKSAKKRMIVLQDPKRMGHITLQRSNNEYGGLEFSYAFWMFIDDWSYKYGEWKHIMHKGNESSWPLRAPGMWLHPKDNTMRVYMNTFKKVDEYVDIENIPLNKWVSVVVAVKQRNLDIFVNGNLAKRHVLSGIPKQNSGDLYINSFRGFSGFMSNIRYYDYYLSFAEMDTFLALGPSKKPCVDTGETPPYLDITWWADK